MSRLIVKNLPAYLTPDRLRKHFEQNGAPPGTITDVKISLKQDGTSRRFGFVGFKTNQEANAARDWFDRTFIDSTRVNVMVVLVSFLLPKCPYFVLKFTHRTQKMLQLLDQIREDAWKTLLQTQDRHRDRTFRRRT
jgi:hypothetical protein